jgi:hypothetical protein
MRINFITFDLRNLIDKASDNTMIVKGTWITAPSIASEKKIPKTLFPERL